VLGFYHVSVFVLIDHAVAIAGVAGMVERSLHVVIEPVLAQFFDVVCGERCTMQCLGALASTGWALDRGHVRSFLLRGVRTSSASSLKNVYPQKLVYVGDVVDIEPDEVEFIVIRRFGQFFDQEGKCFPLVPVPNGIRTSKPIYYFVSLILKRQGF
jgi:hypothetical protein